MQVNINRAIKTIGNVGFYQPLYEGIVNSFQAGANNLKINFILKKDYVIGYKIEDDGEGYTNDNIKSYLELWSEHKIKQGALGSGRILCLKIFDHIITESQTIDSYDEKGNKELAHYITMDFNRNFTANTIEDIYSKEQASEKSFTTTEYKDINDEYIETYEKEKEPFKVEKVCDDIFSELLPMFISFNREEKNFTITIDGKIWLDKNNLQEYFQKQKFEEKSFEIKEDLSRYNKGNEDLKDEHNYKFTLFYRIIKDDKNELKQFYGASGRKVHDFKKGVQLDTLPNGWSGIFCLTSSYFDENGRVKDSRKEFHMHETNPSKNAPIVFTKIKNKLKKLLNEVLLEKFPETEKEFLDRKKLAVEKFPHLSRYIKKNDSLTMSESKMLEQAEKEFLAETKSVRKDVIKFTEKVKQGKNFDEKAYQEITRHFTQVGREQLADYIGYRQTIIDMLIEIYKETSEEKSRFNEKDIHDLFFPQGETSNTSFYYANNIWIFDDKFMSYNYSASDKTIAKIVSDVEKKDSSTIPKTHKNKEPDLVMFYSNPKSEWKDVLLIEFKRLNSTLDDKEKAINQLNRYPKYIRDNIDKIRSIFTYTIIDIDDEFVESLKDIHGFTENAFGDKDNKTSAYYKYNPNVKAHINVVSFSQVLEDANKRNKVFLDILIQNFKA